MPAPASAWRAAPDGLPEASSPPMCRASRGNALTVHDTRAAFGLFGSTLQLVVGGTARTGCRGRVVKCIIKGCDTCTWYNV